MSDESLIMPLIEKNVLPFVETKIMPLVERETDHVTDVVVTKQCNNKIMTISDAAIELESRGFSCDVSSDKSRVVGILSPHCRWLMMARMDVFAFVQEVSVTTKLTVEKIEADLNQAKLYADDRTLGVGCPPQGISRAHMIIVVFLVKGEDEIDLDALSRIFALPDKEFCKVTLLAAQDGLGRSHYFEKTTPLWGKILWPEVRYWAGLLTGRRVDSALPVFGGSITWKIFFLVQSLFFLVSIVLLSVFSPDMLGFALLFCAILTSITQWRNIRARKGKNLQKNSGEIHWCEQQSGVQQLV